jgi:hypothetical protein
VPDVEVHGEGHGGLVGEGFGVVDDHAPSSLGVSDLDCSRNWLGRRLCTTR